MVRAALVFAVFALFTTEAGAQSCQAICNQYYSYARNAGAMGTYGPLVNLYNRCMACKRGARRKRACPKGKVRKGRYCISRGHRICPGAKHSCPQDQQCTANGCIPEEASLCPSGKNHCKAPRICAVGLDGNEGCFPPDVHERLETAKKELKQKAALERQRQKEAVEKARFKREHGKPYKAWLAEVMQLMGQADKADDASGPSATPPPTAQSTQRLASLPAGEAGEDASQALEKVETADLADECELDYLATKWAKEFDFWTCTNKGWAIGKKRDAKECVVLSPEHQLGFLVNPEKEEFPLHVAELVSEEYTLSSEQKAQVALRIDGRTLHQSTQSVSVSDTPPLRYAFSVIADQTARTLIARKYEAVVTVADKPWTIGLTGSMHALNRAKQCASQDRGE